MKKKGIKVILICTCLILFVSSTIYATDSTIEDEELNSLVNILDEYVDDAYNLENIKQDLLSGEGLDYGIIGNAFINTFANEIYSASKISISIFCVILLMAILKSMELEKDSSVGKIAHVVSFLAIVSLVLVNYKDLLELFKNSIEIETKIVQVLSPFVMALLMATGSITSTGLIQPIILFLCSSIGLIINYIIVPLLTVSLVFNIISSISDTVKLNRFAKLLTKISLYILAVVLAIVLGVLGLESSIGTSLDSVTVKTTQAAVSGAVPVVGKFLSDSLEVIMGSAEVVGKVSGVIGILVLLLISFTPIIKLFVIYIIFQLLTAISETINTDEKVVKLFESVSNIYVTMLGILFSVSATFIISVGVIMSLMGKVFS